ncbi:hypothetical protein [Ensifer aridi]|uniref:hypothetical protein n=1 Tax=Ensifer aridi TaxID=1708715 RepID=UPI00358F2C3A
MSVWRDGMAAAQRLSLRRDETVIAAEMRRRQDRYWMMRCLPAADVRLARPQNHRGGTIP